MLENLSFSSRLRCFSSVLEVGLCGLTRAPSYSPCSHKALALKSLSSMWVSLLFAPCSYFFLLQEISSLDTFSKNWALTPLSTHSLVHQRHLPAPFDHYLHRRACFDMTQTRLSPYILILCTTTILSSFWNRQASSLQRWFSCLNCAPNVIVLLFSFRLLLYLSCFPIIFWLIGHFPSLRVLSLCLILFPPGSSLTSSLLSLVHLLPVTFAVSQLFSSRTSWQSQLQSHYSHNW